MFLILIMSLGNLHPQLKENYIIRELESSAAEERPKIALRLLRNLGDRVPMACVGLYGYGKLPPKEDFEDYAKYTNDFFKYISSIDFSPEDRKILEEQFIKKIDENEKKSRWLYTQYNPLSSKIPRLPHHQLPPYIYDWKKSILGEYYYGDLEDFSFTKKLLGKGGFSFVYLVLGPKGEKYALKIFHPSWKFPMERRAFSNEMIVNNVKEKQGMLSEFPKFSNIEAFSPKKHIFEKADEPWYLMDFINGKPAKRQLLGKGSVDNHLKKSVVKEYAEMLRFLHSRDFVFYDNNWGAMMINGNREFAFIDFDMITKVGEEPPVRCFSINYVSRNQLKKESEPTTKNIDLEGFAKMIDHLYVGKPLIDNTEEFRRFEEKREYTQERKQKLPKDLGNVVERVLTEPKCNINIDDFCSAIENIDA